MSANFKGDKGIEFFTHGKNIKYNNNKFVDDDKSTKGCLTINSLYFRDETGVYTIDKTFIMDHFVMKKRLDDIERKFNKLTNSNI